MIDLSHFRPETLLISGIVLGLFLGAFLVTIILGLFQTRRITKARCQAYQAAENLYLKGLATDHRDRTSARL
jgi:uncharacterized membrane protein